MINQLIKSMLPLIVSSGLLALTLSVLPRPLSTFTTARSLDHLTTTSPSLTQDRTSLNQPNSNVITTWADPCTNRRMEIQGIGLGDPDTTLSPRTLSLSDSHQIGWLLAQVAGRKNGDPTNVPTTVTLTTDEPQQVHLDRPVSQTSNGYIFETLLTPTGQITAAASNPGDSYKTPRGFILYSKRETGAELWRSDAPFHL